MTAPKDQMPPLPVPDTLSFGAPVRYHSQDQIYEFAAARVNAATADLRARVVELEADASYWRKRTDEALAALHAERYRNSAARQPVKAEPVGWREFIENIATPCSEPLNSVCGYRDTASRKEMMGLLRARARALLSQQGTKK